MHVRIYVCMFSVCMLYVRLYIRVCVYVCIYVSTHARVSVCIVYSITAQHMLSVYPVFVRSLLSLIHSSK